MIFYDLEVYRYNWMISWLDTTTKKTYTIHDDVEKLSKFYKHYKDTIMVGYNSRHYDMYVLQAILAGFDAWEINDWIINKDRQGWEFSSLLRNFPILNYDCSVGFRGLKELEAFMGVSIEETQVPFDINRPLTKEELEQVRKYNRADVWNCFLVFLETEAEFKSHIGLIREFNLPLWNISKTKAQISAEILGAQFPSRERDDEFDISFIPTLELGKYEYVKEHYQNWADNIRDYEQINLETDIAGVPTVVSAGGIHGAIPNYMDTGNFILADVSSYYPALMIEHGFLSRNVYNPKKFKEIRDDRLVMKANHDPREYPRKIVINATFGATKYKYNKLFDPLQANNICFNGQLALIDLIEKLEGIVSFIQYNTDGIVFKVHNPEDEPKIFAICKEWETRNNFALGYERYTKIIQRDVNNYIFVGKDYTVTKGAVVKRLSNLDNDLPIVNRAVVDYFVNGTDPRETIYSSDKLIDFQKITKITNKYEYGFHEVTHGYELTLGETTYIGTALQERVIRCFASTNPNHGIIYKKHKEKETLDKTASTPERAFIDNGDITDKKVPDHLDRNWYLELAKRRISEFVR